MIKTQRDFEELEDKSLSTFWKTETSIYVIFYQIFYVLFFYITTVYIYHVTISH